MQLGLVTYNLAAEWDIDTMIAACEATGFGAVELRTTHAHGVEPSLTPEQRAEVRAKFEGTDVRLWGLGSTCEYHSPDPDELAAQLQLTRDFVDLAVGVGARGVKVRPNRLPDGVRVEQTLEQIGNSLAEVGAYATDKGVTLWVEVHGQGTCHVPHMKTILDYVPNPMVQACWNCNQPDIIDGSIAENFALLADRIGLVHIHDLCDADYPYSELFDLLKGIQFDGYCMTESPGNEDAQRIMRYQAALWREMTG